MPLDAGGPTTTVHARIPSSDGRHLLSSPSPSIRTGIWRCAMPRAPRQLPSRPPPNRANPMAWANSELDKTWGQGQTNSTLTGSKHDRDTPIGTELCWLGCEKSGLGALTWDCDLHRRGLGKFFHHHYAIIKVDSKY